MLGHMKILNGSGIKLCISQFYENDDFDFSTSVGIKFVKNLILILYKNKVNK